MLREINDGWLGTIKSAHQKCQIKSQGDLTSRSFNVISLRIKFSIYKPCFFFLKRLKVEHGKRRIKKLEPTQYSNFRLWYWRMWFYWRLALWCGYRSFFLTIFSLQFSSQKFWPSIHKAKHEMISFNWLL